MALLQQAFNIAVHVPTSVPVKCAAQKSESSTQSNESASPSSTTATMTVESPAKRNETASTDKTSTSRNRPQSLRWMPVFVVFHHVKLLCHIAATIQCRKMTAAQRLNHAIEGICLLSSTVTKTLDAVSREDHLHTGYKNGVAILLGVCASLTVGLVIWKHIVAEREGEGHAAADEYYRGAQECLSRLGLLVTETLAGEAFLAFFDEQTRRTIQLTISWVCLGSPVVLSVLHSGYSTLSRMGFLKGLANCVRDFAAAAKKPSALWASFRYAKTAKYGVNMAMGEYCCYTTKSTLLSTFLFNGVGLFPVVVCGYFAFGERELTQEDLDRMSFNDMDTDSRTL